MFEGRQASFTSTTVRSPFAIGKDLLAETAG